MTEQWESIVVMVRTTQLLQEQRRNVLALRKRERAAETEQQTPVVDVIITNLSYKLS